MLGLATIDLCTKFEMCTLTHYKDMKGDEKCKNLGVLWVSGHTRSSAKWPFDRVHTTSYLTLIEKMHLTCIVFEL